MPSSTLSPIKKITALTGILLFALILFLPAPEGMESSAQRMMAVALLMAVFWISEAVPISVTALFPLLLFPSLGIMSAGKVAPNYSNHLVFLFLGGFMIALAMEKWNFHKRLALNIISKTGRSVPRLVLGFMIATAFLSMWISNTATTMMMLPVAMAVVRQIANRATLNGKQNADTEESIQRNLGLVLMLGLAYSASIGGVGTLIGTPPNIVFAGFYRELFPDKPEISFVQWMLMALPLVIVFLPVTWLYLCRFISKVPLHKIGMEGNTEIINEELKSMGVMSRAEKYVAIAFAGAAFLWIFRKPLDLGFAKVPGWSTLFENPGYFQDSTVAMTIGLLLMIIPLDLKEGVILNGKREHFVLDWNTVESKTPWGILLLFGGGFALASGFKKTGLDHWIGLHLSSIADMPLLLMILITCLGITFLTELTSNTATATMILPILGAVAHSANIEPLMLMVPAAMSASFAFMLPVATPPNAIVFGSGWVTIPQMSKAGLALNILGAGLISLLIVILMY